MIQQRRSDGYTLGQSYDFRGLTTATYEEQIANGDTTWIRTSYSYKHNGLVDTLLVNTSGDGVAQMVHSYDSLNRLKTIQYGAIKETYSYNPRGWLTEKNVTRNNLPLLNLKLRYETPSNSNSTPQYGGNISEWEWSRNDSETNMYSFEYDNLERLSDSRHYLNASPSNTLEEKGISYDLNGNMLTMKRVDESGDEDDFTYSYSGNQLTSSTYDSNGNMTYDVTSGLSVEWNDLNLIKKVSDGDGVLVNYTYLADGTKIRAVDADGEGLEYRGSLTFRRSSDDTLTPESIAFPGGRFVAMQGADGSIQMVPNYHIADHLGSVRTIVNGSTGRVVETNDYYAFGSRWDRSGSLVDQSNRYRYNGKEEQTTFGTPYSDYGARQYSSFNGRWLTVDPLAEQAYSFSPYLFCSANPINRYDPNGEVDWKLVKLGAFTIAKGVIHTASGATLTAGTSGIGAGVGVFLVVDGMTSIGVGTSILITGFLTDPSEKNDQLAENIPTDAFDTVSKIPDILVGNENHEIEERIDFLEFCYDLATFNPSSIETGMEMFETLSDTYGLYIYMWDILEEEHEKNAIEENTVDSYQIHISY